MATSPNRDARLALAGACVVFIVIPAMLGAVSASPWWRAEIARLDADHQLFLAEYNPVCE